MKKVLFLIIFGLWISFASGNVAAPRAHISEIFFNSPGNWMIEIGFYEYELFLMDSLRVFSSSGSSLVSFMSTLPGGGSPGFDSLSLISDTNLVSPIVINENGDIIKLVYYYLGGNASYDSVIFGNYPNSMLNCIQTGESIAYLLGFTQGNMCTNCFCIDKTPTPGTVTDTNGTMGTFTGNVYDPNGNLLSQGYFLLTDEYGVHIFVVNINPDGSFSERICSRRYMLDTITIIIPSWPYTHETYTIQPIDFCLRPDSSHYEDIITIDLIQGIEQPEEDFGNAVIASPNPFTEHVTFYFNLKGTRSSDDISLEIFSQDGKSLERFHVPVGQNKIEWIPQQIISPGVLVYRLIRNGHVLKTAKIVKL
jgi:hypothetical protein